MIKQQDLLLLYSKLSKTFFILTGSVIVSSAVTFAANSGCIDCVMRFWIPGTDIVAAWVYPTSVVIIGCSLILYGFRFGLRGIGLVVMVCGAFDVFAKIMQLWISGLLNGDFVTGPFVAGGPDPYFWLQNVMMVGGWALAVFPSFKLNRWALASAITLVWAEAVGWPLLRYDFHGLFPYQVYEVFLFYYIYRSTTLRKLSL